MDGIAVLIKQNFSQDNIGQYVASESRTTIYVEQRSISRQEWANAGRIGLNPQTILVTPIVNYNGEEIVEYNGKRYNVYRTYETGDNIELYLEKKGGTDESSSI